MTVEETGTANSGKEAPPKDSLADRGMAAIDPLGEGLCTPVSCLFDGFGRAELPVKVGFRARRT